MDRGYGSGGFGGGFGSGGGFGGDVDQSSRGFGRHSGDGDDDGRDGFGGGGFGGGFGRDRDADAYGNEDYGNRGFGRGRMNNFSGEKGRGGRSFGRGRGDGGYYGGDDAGGNGFGGFGRRGGNDNYYDGDDAGDGGGFGGSGRRGRGGSGGGNYGGGSGFGGPGRRGGGGGSYYDDNGRDGRFGGSERRSGGQYSDDGETRGFGRSSGYDNEGSGRGNGYGGGYRGRRGFRARGFGGYRGENGDQNEDSGGFGGQGRFSSDSAEDFSGRRGRGRGFYRGSEEGFGGSGYGGRGDYGGYGGRRRYESDEDSQSNSVYRRGGGGRGGGTAPGFGEQQNGDPSYGRRSHGDYDGGMGRRELQEGQAYGKPTATMPKLVNYVPKALTDEDFAYHIAAGEFFARQLEVEVQTIGDNCPDPVTRFEDMNLDHLLLDCLKMYEIKVPTLVQRHAVPVVKAGRDYIACAQTGSGKTIAYLLPILDSLLREGSKERSYGPRALIMVPTRELAVQISTVCIRFLKNTELQSAVVYGGVSVAHQLSQLSVGCDVLIATPGRLVDFMNRQRVRLRNTRFFVLDEADRMLDMGFEDELRHVAHHLENVEHQTLMFSATFPSSVQVLAKDYLNTNYVFQVIGTLGGANQDITQQVIQVSASDKEDKLLELVQTMIAERPKAKILVFVGRKRVADFVAAALGHRGITTTSIHGDREQCQRELALSDFKHGRANVLVATEVASRGLDIVGVDQVINYDLPTNIDDYVHRIGRTGRVGHAGLAVSFYDSIADGGLSLRLVETLRASNQEVPSWLLDGSCDADDGALRGGAAYGDTGDYGLSVEAVTGQYNNKNDDDW